MMSGVGGRFFLANSLATIKHAPFDGTVYPVSKFADWANMSDSERELSFNDLSDSKKIDPIPYNSSDLSIPLDELDFSGDKKLRTAKIAYSVPYLGSYKLNGIEGDGSHAAVDIKVPTGTPVLAVMNGVVVKAEDQPWGFGQHIVIRHNNVPSVDDNTVTTDYFSCYAHMSTLSVQVGDVVTKGQVIGYSGSSGTATTPHLHFQIDKSNAPWHPFWPFTADEANSAKLSFFDAINEGLGRNEGKDKTINPMVYVQRYLNVSTLLASAPSDVDYVDSSIDDSTQVQLDVESHDPIEEVNVDDLDMDAVTLFSDVNDSDFDYKYIASLKDKGVFKGFDDGSFRPDSKVTRVQALKIVFTSIGENRFKQSESVRFADADSTQWYFDYLGKAAYYNIVDSNKLVFEPEREVNLAEYLKMLYIAAKVDLDPEVSDKYSTLFDTKAWFAPYLVESIKRNIISENEAIEVQNTLARRDVARVTYKFLKAMKSTTGKYVGA